MGKETSKVLGSRPGPIIIEFLNSDYNEPIVADIPTMDNGRPGNLLRIEPKRPDWLSFTGRWDQADENIDIDLHGEPEETHKFGTRQGGYRGYRTDKVRDSPRTYQLDIETPTTGRVFKGSITVNHDFGESLTFNVNAEIKAAAEV